ncbi:hypothetical protein BT67DRAFT_61400 [Trichocladium antarcticum]|uniref:Uncharacterized protein n=1 Tax=Trichocladium antarcticum TaxID=1450529 RepID=A0AAN6UHT6_9PEZI|nr:hypothetical protein BT67DRAFT_61400 [Trichocladium antarcticum]
MTATLGMEAARGLEERGAQFEISGPKEAMANWDHECQPADTPAARLARHKWTRSRPVTAPPELWQGSHQLWEYLVPVDAWLIRTLQARLIALERERYERSHALAEGNSAPPSAICDATAIREEEHPTCGGAQRFMSLMPPPPSFPLPSSPSHILERL